MFPSSELTPEGQTYPVEGYNRAKPQHQRRKPKPRSAVRNVFGIRPGRQHFERMCAQSPTLAVWIDRIWLCKRQMWIDLPMRRRLTLGPRMIVFEMIEVVVRHLTEVDHFILRQETQDHVCLHRIHVDHSFVITAALFPNLPMTQPDSDAGKVELTLGTCVLGRQVWAKTLDKKLNARQFRTFHSES